MIVGLTHLALVIAILLFAASLPFAAHPAGGSLRRGAAFVFAMAFIPALLAYVFGPVFARSHSFAGRIGLGLAGCGLAAILLVFSFASYGFLELVKRGKSRQPSAHAEHIRYAKRRHVHERDEAHDHDEEEH